MSSVTNVAANANFASASSIGCKVRTITDANGIVKTLNTEDANVGGGLLGAAGA